MLNTGFRRSEGLKTFNKNKPINAIYKNALITVMIRNYETHKYSLYQSAYPFVGTDCKYNKS